MSNTNEQQAKLCKAIWQVTEDLYGSMDDWEFNKYIINALFYRFISENLSVYLAQVKNDPSFDYSQLTDKQAEYDRAKTIEEKGFFIPPSELFCNILNCVDPNGMRKTKNGKNLSELLEQVFKNIEDSAIGTASEDSLKGLFDDMDVNSIKLGNTATERNKKLYKLIKEIGRLDLGDVSQDNYTNNFGRAFEYLVSTYTPNRGKLTAGFFTPRDITKLLTSIAISDKTEVNKVYDPCCGSGGLLLKFANILGKENVHGGFFGQETDLTICKLARMNMFLNKIDFNKFNVSNTDALANPAHWDAGSFDVIVANPPYSIKWEGENNPLNIEDPRFSPAGVLAPTDKSDMAFIMHILNQLSVNGTAAIGESPGVLYRGGAEKKIRKYLIVNNFIEAVIQLPANLFFGTTIAICILVMKKNKTTGDILFIDASEEFEHRGSKNKLMPQNIDRILKATKERKDINYFSKCVSNDDVIKNDANLSVGLYVERKNAREEIDIAALNAHVAHIVARENEMHRKINAIIADLERNDETK